MLCYVVFMFVMRSKMEERAKTDEDGSDRSPVERHKEARQSLEMHIVITCGSSWAKRRLRRSCMRASHALLGRLVAAPPQMRSGEVARATSPNPEPKGFHAQITDAKSPTAPKTALILDRDDRDDDLSSYKLIYQPRYGKLS